MQAKIIYQSVFQKIGGQPRASFTENIVTLLLLAQQMQHLKQVKPLAALIRFQTIYAHALFAQRLCSG